MLLSIPSFYCHQHFYPAIIFVLFCDFNLTFQPSVYPFFAIRLLFLTSQSFFYCLHFPCFVIKLLPDFGFSIPLNSSPAYFSKHYTKEIQTSFHTISWIALWILWFLSVDLLHQTFQGFFKRSDSTEKAG